MNNYAKILLALCLWREARNQSDDAIRAVAWSIRNRVSHPTWWGKNWIDVITHPFQYSSFNKNDPNSYKFPSSLDLKMPICISIAEEVYSALEGDPTNGAVSYYDRSLDNNPPEWAKTAIHTCDIGAFRFFRF